MSRENVNRRTLLKTIGATGLTTVGAVSSAAADTEVTNLRALSRYPDSVDLAWESSGDPVERYQVEVNGETVKETEFTVTDLSGLEPDTDYTIAVTPIPENGGSGYGATLELTTRPFCELNSNFFTVEDAGPNSIAISWDSCDQSVTLRDHWQVYVDDQKHQTVPGDQTRATITGLEPDTEYSVEIAPVAADGTEGPTDSFRSAKTTPPDNEAPTPANVQAEVSGESSVTVTWDAVTDEKSGLDQYVVYVDDSRETTVAADAESPSATVDGLSVGDHAIAVTAVDNAGNESDRASVDVTIPDPTDSIVGVSLSSGEITTDESVTGTVTLAEAPNGVSGFQITVSVADPSVATIEGASISDPFGNPTDPSISDDGSAATIKGADLSSDVSPGESDVALATVDLQAQSEGSTSVDVAVETVDGNGGESIATTTQAATLDVVSIPVEPIDGTMPTDPDGDGLYEDINGNEELDFADVTQYFEHMGDPAMTNHSDAYDFNGNGEIDFADLVDLFEQV